MSPVKMRSILPALLALSLLAGCGSAGQTVSPQPSPGRESPGGPVMVIQPSAGPSLSPQPSPSSPPPIDLSGLVLAQADYPEFPTRPELPEDRDIWDSDYRRAEMEYWKAVEELRGGCRWALTSGRPAVARFAARSAPLALAGHERENAVYSPLSLWTALAMEAECAGGETRAQILDALGTEESDLDLLDMVERLGMTDLLDPDRADLSNLTDIPAYLGRVLQLARVEVDEEEIEAAAVTILDAPATAMPQEEGEVCVMDLDRTFLFMVRAQGVPVFVGVVNCPSPNM